MLRRLLVGFLAALVVLGVWIAVDLIYVPLYLSRDLHLTALTYIVFLGLCVLGWRQWSATASS